MKLLRLLKVAAIKQKNDQPTALKAALNSEVNGKVLKTIRSPSKVDGII